MDWTERFLRGGKKIFAFHTFDLETRGCWESIFADKSAASVIDHLKNVWKTREIPQSLQMDNDAAFYGSRKVPHHFGRVVRLCLYVGLEPIFIPVGEPERNGDVEQAHRTWDKAVWQRVCFESVQAAQAFTPQFEQWYMNEYEPPKLKRRTPERSSVSTSAFSIDGGGVSNDSGDVADHRGACPFYSAGKCRRRD
jgi:transposase InsO family protein